MNLLAIILLGAINIAMVVHYLLKQGGFYHFPFWYAVLVLGWFFPQAIGSYAHAQDFPQGAYAGGILFAALCSAGTWAGYAWAVEREAEPSRFLSAQFNTKRLYMAAAALCVCGFFFQYKLKTLPDELIAMTQWSGAAVKYLFLSNIFLFGFIALWLMYLSKGRWMVPKMLLFIVPSLLLLLDSAVVDGRRSAMMSLMSYTVVSLWFVRRVAVPRWLILVGLSAGLLLVNAIGTYRSIMGNKEASLTSRLTEAAKMDYTQTTADVMEKGGSELNNYLFYRHVVAEDHLYDYGLVHWNRLVFNFVPAQIVGRGIKDALMLEKKVNPARVAEARYGHGYKTGTTSTGFRDAFASFGWLGFIKFMVIGGMMGALFRHAMQGHFFGQLLYVYLLSPAMHAVSHDTHRVLISMWVYFFMLGFPALFWARIRPEEGVAEVELNAG